MTGELALYHEVRGSGPVVLLVPPAPGDAGHFDALSRCLDGCTVVTYDRRGTGRSPRPLAWSVTTVAEQADDAATVLRQVTGDAAVVYGTSNGGLIALELALRHPALLSAVLVHEMPLLSVVDDPAPIGQLLGDLLGKGMESGGPVGALDAFLRFAYGDRLVDELDPALRARFDAAAETVVKTSSCRRSRRTVPTSGRSGPSTCRCTCWSAATSSSRSSPRRPTGWPSGWGPRWCPAPAPTGRTCHTRPSWPP